MALKTQKEFARQIKKSPQYVNKLVTQGKILLQDGKVDTKQALAAIETFSRVGNKVKGERAGARGKTASGRAERASRESSKTKVKNKGAAGGGGKSKAAARSAAAPREAKPRFHRPPAEGTITAHRLVREEFEAKLAKAKFEQLSGSLLPARDVLEAQHRKNANIRSKFRQLPRSCALLVSRANTPAEVEQLLLVEIDAVLAQLAKDPLGLDEKAIVGGDVAALMPAADAGAAMPTAILPAVQTPAGVEANL